MLRTSVNKQPKKVKSVKQTIDSITAAAAQFLTPLQLSIMRTQMIANKRPSKGMRWPNEVKTFALQLHYKEHRLINFCPTRLPCKFRHTAEVRH
jgi:hypothetical protein